MREWVSPKRVWTSDNKNRAAASRFRSMRRDFDYGNTAQFVGSVGDAFFAICCLQIFRFTSSKPSKSAIASDEKCFRLRTNSFVRYCLMNAQPLRSSPKKNSATVPGPVWLPMVVPMELISTFPVRWGKRASTRSATARASS